MRFTKKKRMQEAYFNGDRKSIEKFLWFPITIDGETRWLERAIVEYHVQQQIGVFDTYYFWAPWQFKN